MPTDVHASFLRRPDRLVHRAGALPPAVPADDTAGAASPSRDASAARRNPSAIGERQTFPVHTTRIPLITKAASLATPPRPAGARRARHRSRPRPQDAGGSVREVHDGRRRALERLVLAQVDGDVAAEQLAQLGARRRGRPPLRFALVTASGPVSWSTASATGWFGARTPTVAGSPPRSHPRRPRPGAAPP